MLHHASYRRPGGGGYRQVAAQDDDQDPNGQRDQNVPPRNTSPTTQLANGNKRTRDDDEDILSSGPRKRPYVDSSVLYLVHGLPTVPAISRSRTDPLVSNGRHFGRTIHAFCRILPLIKESLARYIQIQAHLIAYGDLTDQ